jgi:hypothetical protein
VAQSDNSEWTSYATLPADARLRNSFAQLYLSVGRAISLARQHDPRIVQDRGALPERLQQIYTAAAQGCAITYTNSAGKPVSLNLDQIGQRLFALDFDPYHCIERRWGATSAEELASCKDDDIKTVWYKAEQGLRNQINAGYVLPQPLSLAEIQKSGAQPPGSFDMIAFMQGGAPENRLLLDLEGTQPAPLVH